MASYGKVRRRRPILTAGSCTRLAENGRGPRLLSALAAALLVTFCLDELVDQVGHVLEQVG